MKCLHQNQREWRKTLFEVPFSQGAMGSPHFVLPGLRRCALLFGVLAGMSSLAGCSSASGGGVLDQALQAVGLQKPAVQLPDTATNATAGVASKSSKVVIRLHAGQVLNTDSSGKSLPVVARIYKLKDKDAFLQASDTAFADMKASKSSELSSDIEDVKEVVLTPGQRYEVTETVPSDSPYIGVVALFRSPAERRWRFVFETKPSAKTGLTLGVHGCALSVATGQAVGVDAELTRLAGVECS